MWCTTYFICCTCDVLHYCSASDVFYVWCLVMCSNYDVFYSNVLHSCSTCVLLPDKQLISTDIIMLCCYVLCQLMSTCVVKCYIHMCYDVLCQDVPHCNNSSHYVSTHICASSTMEHNYPSITSLWKPCYIYLRIVFVSVYVIICLLGWIIQAL